MRRDEQTPWRPVRVRMSVFPPGTASGLWLDMADQDLVVVEERTAPEHQLVILGHELWHMQAGHGGHHVDGATVAARLLDETSDLAATVRAVAARTRFDLAEERDAERFGLLLASKCRTWLAGGRRPGCGARHQAGGASGGADRGVARLPGLTGGHARRRGLVRAALSGGNRRRARTDCQWWAASWV
ncbi:hypothetical protein GCM10020256_08050 [Streptomyces thermocoprophilus]